MSVYKKGECQSCGSYPVEVATFKHHFARATSEEEVDMCEICANTGTSKQFLYGSNHIDSHDVLRAIAQVANIIRKDIKKLSSENYGESNRKS
jgi:hypothetical protein